MSKSCWENGAESLFNTGLPQSSICKKHNKLKRNKLRYAYNGELHDGS